MSYYSEERERIVPPGMFHITQSDYVASHDGRFPDFYIVMARFTPDTTYMNAKLYDPLKNQSTIGICPIMHEYSYTSRTKRQRLS